MSVNPFESLADYSRYIAELFGRRTVRHSTVAVWSDSPYTGIAEGEVHFVKGFCLRIREELDFDARLIASYGYEVYQGEERLYWYDDFPHPGDLALAPTFPHHKHIQPNIERHRVPAPEIDTARPNLPVLIREVEELIERAA